MAKSICCGIDIEDMGVFQYLSSSLDSSVPWAAMVPYIFFLIFRGSPLRKCYVPRVLVVYRYYPLQLVKLTVLPVGRKHCYTHRKHVAGMPYFP